MEKAAAIEKIFEDSQSKKSCYRADSLIQLLKEALKFHEEANSIVGNLNQLTTETIVTDAKKNDDYQKIETEFF